MKGEQLQNQFTDRISLLSITNPSVNFWVLGTCLVSHQWSAFQLILDLILRHCLGCKELLCNFLIDANFWEDDEKILLYKMDSWDRQIHVYWVCHLRLQQNSDCIALQSCSHVSPAANRCPHVPPPRSPVLRTPRLSAADSQRDPRPAALPHHPAECKAPFGKNTRVTGHSDLVAVV